MKIQTTTYAHRHFNIFLCQDPQIPALGLCALVSSLRQVNVNSVLKKILQ